MKRRFYEEKWLPLSIASEGRVKALNKLATEGWHVVNFVPHENGFLYLSLQRESNMTSLADTLQAVYRQRDHGIKPRVHGNGFIQLDMARDVRLHVWGDPRIPRQKTFCQIHDHIFSFDSELIVGQLINIWYDTELVIGGHGAYKIYEPFPRGGQDTGLKDTGHTVDIFQKPPVLLRTMHPFADHYHMKWGEFHETIASGPAATIMHKNGPSQLETYTSLGIDLNNINPDGSDYHLMDALDTRKPRVLVPVGQEPDNEFRRDMFDDRLLWTIIFDTLWEYSR
jgi:hypothetical protein